MAGDRNKTRLVGWHPSSAGLVAALDAEIERRGGGRGVQSAILDEALARFLGLPSGETAVTTAPGLPVAVIAAEDEPAQPAGKNCKHRNMRMAKGICPDCHQPVGYR